jgi:hypothetical protein
MSSFSKGHVSKKDGRRYVLDFGRVYPPTHSDRVAKTFLYQVSCVVDDDDDDDDDVVVDIVIDHRHVSIFDQSLWRRITRRSRPTSIRVLLPPIVVVVCKLIARCVVVVAVVVVVVVVVMCF